MFATRRNRNKQDKKTVFKYFAQNLLSIRWPGFFAALFHLLVLPIFNGSTKRPDIWKILFYKKKTDSGKYNEIVSSTAHAQLHTIAITDIQNGWVPKDLQVIRITLRAGVIYKNFVLF